MVFPPVPPVDIEKVTFLGASLSSLSSNVGWNENSSTIEVVLVEDDGEVFTRPDPGTPVALDVGALHFEGIVLTWKKNNTPSSITYSVRVSDPRIILESVQVILSNYSGPRLDYPNLLDVYGYFERQGFGLSGANEGGMRWTKIKEGLTEISNIRFKGHSYTINYDGLPTPPAFYRMGGGAGAVTLLQLINDLCADAGYQYIVRLDGTTIRFQSVSLREQPGLTFVQNFLNSLPEKSSYSQGLELIQGDLYTTAIISGGNVEEMYTDGVPFPYWGRDVNGNVVIGGSDSNGYYAVIDATPIADIIGTASYRVDEIELRCALIDQSCWATYLFKNKQSVAEAITGFRNEYEIPEAIQNPLGHIDTLNDSRENAIRISSLGTEDESNAAKFKRAYEFIANIASNYYGRMFLVRLNFVQRKLEEETGILTYSHQTSSSAYFNGGALGLRAEFSDLLQDDTGKYVPFCKFPNAINNSDDTLDISKVSVDNTIIQGADAFIKCDISDVFHSNGSNYVLVTLSDVAYAAPQIILGDFEALKFAYGVNPAQEDFIKKVRLGGNTPLKIHPRAVTPTSVAIPLLNNTSTYGPWVISSGKEGKVYFEQSSDLVPWNYGGYANMEVAALSRIQDKVIGLQDVEVGQVEIPGIPAFNLGDALYGNGPTITSIDLRVGDDGITTVYSMQTYTPKFGAFSRQNSDRLNRINRNSIQNVREIKQAKRAKKARQQILANANTSQRLIDKQPESQKLKASSTHTIIAGMYHDGTEGKRNIISSLSSEDALTNLNLNDVELFKKSAAVDQSYFYRPISLDIESENICHLEDPDDDEDEKQTPHSKDLNPYIDYDTAKTTSNVITWGDDYQGFNLLKNEDTFDPTKVRTMALRGPIMLVGWGYDLLNEELVEEKSEITDWKVGPIDLRFDKTRKVWTCPIPIAAHTIEEINSGEKGRVRLEGTWDGEENKEIEVINWFSSDVPAGYKCFIGYVKSIGLALINLDCSPS